MHGVAAAFNKKSQLRSGTIDWHTHSRSLFLLQKTLFDIFFSLIPGLLRVKGPVFTVRVHVTPDDPDEDIMPKCSDIITHAHGMVHWCSVYCKSEDYSDLPCLYILYR